MNLWSDILCSEYNKRKQIMQVSTTIFLLCIVMKYRGIMPITKWSTKREWKKGSKNQAMFLDILKEQKFQKSLQKPFKERSFQKSWEKSLSSSSFLFFCLSSPCKHTQSFNPCYYCAASVNLSRPVSQKSVFLIQRWLHFNKSTMKTKVPQKAIHLSKAYTWGWY